MKSNLKTTQFIITFLALLLTYSCSKDKSSPNDACAGKNIIISATVTPSVTCTSNGKIIADATGSTGFSFKLNKDSAYQTSTEFNNVAEGDYTLYAKDAEGCEKTFAVKVTSTGTAGTLFTNVKNLIAAKCQGCHNNTNQNGGMNWTADCNIVTNKTRIKARAVDIGDMPKGGPSLSASEKAIITNWINAGGAFTD